MIRQAIFRINSTKFVRNFANLSELKKKSLKMFQENPQKFYPISVFKEIGFVRAKCPICGSYYWHKNTNIEQKTCGDSKYFKMNLHNRCMSKYTFIKPKPSNLSLISYSQAWNGFRDLFTNSDNSTKITSIKRYPVAARWRNDVDFTAAGIFCFQPHCVTGEASPPANPLICPQFCLRFNDLDNIGITGRHYSGFIMLGIQAFNKQGEKDKLSKEKCVELNYKWLTKTLKIDPQDITFIEDVWAGGGNLGPSIEYFVGGLEIGNMVFMQYKSFPNGELQDLPIKVIDVGIGLERIPWLINGENTSYKSTFGTAYLYLDEKFSKIKSESKKSQEIWEKFAPYSCLLNIDETENINQAWENISKNINIPVPVLLKEINYQKNLSIILDHTRTLLIAINDGVLPSNVGGGNNLRNCLRRVFSILNKNGLLESDSSLALISEICDLHSNELSKIYGKQTDLVKNETFEKIIEMEYKKWINTDETQKKQFTKLLSKRKGNLKLEDWILAVSTWGIPADKISEISKNEIPQNLYQTIYNLNEQKNLINNDDKLENFDKINFEIKPTKSLIKHGKNCPMNFEAKILHILSDKNKKSIIILDQSAFYPTSGGQDCDTGTLEIQGKIYNVEKCLIKDNLIYHFIDNSLSDTKNLIVIFKTF